MLYRFFGGWSDLNYSGKVVRIGHPVRSAILKHQMGGLVVEWATISENLLLYVLWFSFAAFFGFVEGCVAHGGAWSGYG